MVKIGTHNGTFHADEALAVYMLRLLPLYRDAEVVRSRDPAVLDACDIVVDVSGRYDPPKYYDHHQREFTTTFDDKHTVTKLSSAGLVYKHYGREVVATLLSVGPNDPVVDAVYPKVYDSFIEPVDAYDNGVSPHDDKPRFNTYGTTLRAAVANLNPLWTESDTPADYDRQFTKASELMGLAFEGEVRSQGKSWYPAKSAVKAAFAARRKYDAEGRLLVLPEEYVPWAGHIYDIEAEAAGTPDESKILYVIYRSQDSVRVQAVAVSKGAFESRKALPEEWRGLRDEKLAEASGAKTAVFVHAAGFIGGAKELDDALLLAKKALDA